MGMGRLRPDSEYGENSLPGFLAALELGADGIEMDVHLTADDDVIVHHDYRLGRTTTVGAIGDVRLVGHLQAPELVQVPLRGTVPSTVPTLRAVVDALASVLGQREMWVELKRQVPGRNRRLVARTLDVLEGSAIWPNVVVRSFDNDLLVQTRMRCPDARLHALSITRIDHAVRVAEHYGFEGIAIFHPLSRPAFCGPVCRAGLTVTAGGEPSESELDRLLFQASQYHDIDYICTDKIAYALDRRAAVQRGRPD